MKSTIRKSAISKNKHKIKGIPAVEGLKFSIEEKNAKSVSCGKCLLGDMPVRGQAQKIQPLDGQFFFSIL